MEFNKPIADMLPGMDVEGFYILRAAALKTTNSGKPFLSGTICDRTGSVEIKIWDYSGPIGARPGRYRPRRKDPRQRLGIPRCAADQRPPHPYGRGGGRL